MANFMKKVPSGKVITTDTLRKAMEKNIMQI